MHGFGVEEGKGGGGGGDEGDHGDDDDNDNDVPKMCSFQWSFVREGKNCIRGTGG